VLDSFAFAVYAEGIPYGHVTVQERWISSLLAALCLWDILLLI
jgi:hypothetical protein